MKHSLIIINAVLKSPQEMHVYTYIRTIIFLKKNSKQKKNNLLFKYQKILNLLLIILTVWQLCYATKNCLLFISYRFNFYQKEKLKCSINNRLWYDKWMYINRIKVKYKIGFVKFFIYWRYYVLKIGFM